MSVRLVLVCMGGTLFPWPDADQPAPCPLHTHTRFLSADGSLLWKFETQNDVESVPSTDASGTVYFGSNDGNLYALDGPSGACSSRVPFGCVCLCVFVCCGER